MMLLQSSFKKNNLLSVIRAHEAQLEGYKMHKANPATGFPSVITVFSAPNYCDVYNNKAAILKFDNSTLNILQFTCSPHPYHLPNFMDVFTWSMPFVIEKVTEMLFYIIQPDASSKDDQQEELPDLPTNVATQYRKSLSAEKNKAIELASKLSALSENSEGTSKKEEEQTRERLRNKVRTIAKMARMFKSKRQEHETVIRLKGACPDSKINASLLVAGKDRRATLEDTFGIAVGVDKQNEMRPEAAPVNPDDGRDFAEDKADDAEGRRLPDEAKLTRFLIDEREPLSCNFLFATAPRA